MLPSRRCTFRPLPRPAVTATSRLAMPVFWRCFGRDLGACRSDYNDLCLMDESFIRLLPPAGPLWSIHCHRTGTSLGDVAQLDTMVTVVDAASMLKVVSSIEWLKDTGQEAGPGNFFSLLNH